MRLVYRMNGAKHRNEDDYQHHDHVNTQAPKHRAHSSRKPLPAETHVLLRGNNLVRLKKRQDHTRIFEVWLPIVRNDRSNVRPASSGF